MQEDIDIEFSNENFESIDDNFEDSFDDSFEHDNGDNVIDIDFPSTVDESSTVVVKESLHKIPGKHRLKWDSIFKGRKTTDADLEDEHFTMNQSIEIQSSSPWYEDLNSGEEKLRLKSLKEKIHKLVIEKTKLNLKANRRKPSKLDFNEYYKMLLNELKDDSFSRSEIFVEFSGYFSDSVYNMFKLLEKKWRVLIIDDLTKKYKITDLDSLDFN